VAGDSLACVSGVGRAMLVLVAIEGDSQMNPTFIGVPDVMHLPGEGKERAVVLKDFGFRDSKGNFGWILRGDITDANSIPKCLEWLAGNPWEHPWPSFIHDGEYLCCLQKRIVCDRMFREALACPLATLVRKGNRTVVMRFAGKSADIIKQRRFYSAVRLGGHWAYKDRDPDDVGRFDLIPHHEMNIPSDIHIPCEFHDILHAHRKRAMKWWLDIDSKLESMK